jgi:hypothetical protein
MKPDLVWFKSRNQGNGHRLVDSVRGVGKALVAQGTDSEKTETTGLTSFDINGYSIGSASDYNASSPSTTYVNWAWKAGGNKNTFNVDDVGYASAAAAGLTGGSYSLTGASVGTKQGFSIVQWTHSSGTAGTINHGLSEAPTFIIYKSTANTTRWTVGHNSLGWNTGLVLNSSDGQLADDPAYFNNTAPTSSVFSIGDTGQIGNGNTIAYCWHDVPGLQKFGKYSGNQSADGPFIELGFRPAMVWVKGIGSGSTSWRIFDKERNPTNTSTTLYLRPNVANGDLDDTRPIDIVSNGFKIRVAAGGDINLSSGAYDYIYCAWADVPSIDLYGGGANAR